MDCVATFIAPLYSTFVVDNAIEAFFFIDQQIVPKPKLKKYPEVDFWFVPSPSQLELASWHSISHSHMTPSHIRVFFWNPSNVTHVVPTCIWRLP